MDYITVKRAREAIATAQNELEFTRKELNATTASGFEIYNQSQQLKVTCETLDTALLILDMLLKGGDDEK